MKLFLYSILLLGLASPIMAADTTTTKKDKDKDATKAEVKSDAKPDAKPKADKPKEKAAKAPSASDKALADSLSAAQKTKLMSILNTGDEKELSALPGIGLIKATAIKTARPLKEPTDLLNVMGIGEATYTGIINYAKADFTTKPKAPKKKDDTKKTEEKTTK